MNTVWKSMASGIVLLVAALIGRLCGAACYQGCADIEAYRYASINKCMVWGTRLNDPMEHCSFDFGFDTRVLNPVNGAGQCALDENDIDIYLYTCQLSDCSEVCQMAQGKREMSFDKPDLTGCQRGAASRKLKDCAQSP